MARSKKIGRPDDRLADRRADVRRYRRVDRAILVEGSYAIDSEGSRVRLAPMAHHRRLDRLSRNNIESCGSRRVERSRDYFLVWANVHAIGLAMKSCGDRLTRENLICQATSLHGARLPEMVLGVQISTTPTD